MSGIIILGEKTTPFFFSYSNPPRSLTVHFQLLVQAFQDLFGNFEQNLPDLQFLTWNSILLVSKRNILTE